MDAFIEELDQDELLGRNVSFDAYGYVNATFTKATNKDAAKYQPYLGWRPLEVVRQTLENTTQMARTHQRENMRDIPKHYFLSLIVFDFMKLCLQIPSFPLLVISLEQLMLKFSMV